MEVLYPFLRNCLGYICEFCTKPWDAGSDGYITINNTIYALIRIIDDCAQIICTKNYDAVADAYKIYEEMKDGFLFYLAETLLGLSDEDRQRIRTGKGASGPVDAYRIIQVALNQKYPEYINDDLAKYIEEKCQNNNPAAGDLLERLENHLRNIIRDEYESQQKVWLKEYVPEKLGDSWISKEALAKHKGETFSIWDLISFDTIKELAKYKANWSNFYKGFLEIGGKSKMETLNWLENMAQYKKSVENNRQILTSQYQEIEEIAQVFGIYVE